MTDISKPMLKKALNNHDPLFLSACVQCVEGVSFNADVYALVLGQSVFKEATWLFARFTALVLVACSGTQDMGAAQDVLIGSQES